MRGRWLQCSAVLPGIAIVLIVFITACGGGRQPPAPSSYPASVPLLAVSEEKGANTEFWLIDPRNQSHRWKFATVPHRPDWGVRASVAPDGKTLVYATMPKDARDPNTEADLWALPASGRNARRLATGIDLRSGLVWSPDSSWVSYDRQTGGDGQTRRVNLVGAGDQLVARSTADSRWYMMGYDPDGNTAVLAHLTAGGTEVLTERVGDPAGMRTPVGAGSSRDFTVSPQGRPALLLLIDEDGRKVFRAMAGETNGGFVRLTSGGLEDTGIAWDPRTLEPTVGSVPSTTGAAVPALAGVHTIVPPTGFDVPLAWAPDSSVLVVRHFDGATTDQSGSETLNLVQSDGTRIAITGTSAPAFVGWMNPTRS